MAASSEDNKQLRIVIVKFNLFFFSNINSYYQTTDLNVLFQRLFSFKAFLTKFSKETLAVTLLFECNFLLVVGTSNSI